MKKKIELKELIRYTNDKDFWICGGEFDPKAVPCTITFEIEVPEPKVEVTPSMIDALWPDSPDSSVKGFKIALKEKLFGRPSEG